MGFGPEGKARPRERPEAATRLALPLWQFFTTAPIPCPYVAGRAERKLVFELSGEGARGIYDDLSRAGFRRSHRFAYRPTCRGCASCVPVRIAAARFSYSRSTRRIANMNRDLSARLAAPRATIEQFRLFITYERWRHGDSEMAAMTFADYRAMVEETPLQSHIVEFRDERDNLVAAVLIDRLDDGLSAVYSFYDPRGEKKSLGIWSILWLVEECRRRGAAYVYLGYWIAESPKMSYKSRFAGLERLAPGGWNRFESGGMGF
jgi:leucyl-tRNA---protein transferase